MFTGIIEEVGQVERITKGEKSSKLRIRASKVLKGTNLGDSICTSGVCLTVTKLGENYFEADVMAETIRRSWFNNLNIGHKVNLERAMSLESRFGGHIVSGHVDGTGKINTVKQEDNAVWINILADEKILRYIVEKGSITIDGISLTVAEIDEDSLSVSIIPHTGKETTLLDKKPGEVVNLECDVLAKYVEKLIKSPNSDKCKDSVISENYLIENGFI